MYKLVEVKTSKEIKDFISLPNKLYKGNKYYCPALNINERSIFKKNNIYLETCDQIFYLVYKDSICVGRIQGIIQKQYNEIYNSKIARFTRFDSINDTNVSKLLFDAVKNWAKEKGMNEIKGPLGYSDLEREGLLIEGFNELSTFEEQYNFSYYKDLINDYGFISDVDWVESELTYNKEKGVKIRKISKAVMEKYSLHKEKQRIFESKKNYIDRISKDFFALLDEGYKDLYGTVPFTDKMINEVMKEFKLILNPKYILLLKNKDNKPVAFAMAMPQLSKALVNSNGRLSIKTILKLIHDINKPKTIDLGLVSITKEYLSTGVIAVILELIVDAFDKYGIETMETNLNLENNVKVRALWKYFNERNHKRRRSYKINI